MDDSQTSFPAALPPLAQPIITINSALIDKVVQMSRKSPRKRIIFPFHKSGEDKLHRMLNAIQPNSYIQPHRHISANKSEGIILLKGAIAYFTYDEKGTITNKFKLAAGSLSFGIDTEPETFHSFIALEEDTVIYEVKPGPYNKTLDKDFASWAPEEHTEAAATYMNHLYQLAKELA